MLSAGESASTSKAPLIFDKQNWFLRQKLRNTEDIFGPSILEIDKEQAVADADVETDVYWTLHLFKGFWKPSHIVDDLKCFLQIARDNILL